jgi:hypothetical protein
METTSTQHPEGQHGWATPAALSRWVGDDWSTAAYPGPGAALAITLPASSSSSSSSLSSSQPQQKQQRMLFCGHAGAYLQDVAFFSDDGGETFNVSKSTPYKTENNVLKGMDECAFAELSNGTVLLVMRNFGGYKEHDPRGLHNPRCKDHGICKAYSKSDDYGLTWTQPQYFADVRSGSCEAGVLVDKEHGGFYISVGDSDAPPNMGRMRMTLHRSHDGGASWNDGLLLDPNRSAYSQLITLSSRPGEIGVLWEALSPDNVFIGEMRLQWISTSAAKSSVAPPP